MLSNRRTNPLRPPKWRWLRARQLVTERGNLRRKLDDAHVAAARSFCLSVSHCETERSLVTPLHRYPVMYEAWALHQGFDSPRYREEIEARILARETNEEIAAKIGVSAEVIDAYERTFFDVRDRLDYKSFIVHGVIKPAAVRPDVRQRTADFLWKFYGYFCGPYVLDSLISDFCNPQRPESAEQLTDFWIEEGKRLTAMKGALAIRATEINWQTQTEIAKLFFRLLKLQKKERASGGGGSGDYLKNVQAMLDNLPWGVYGVTDAQADTAVKRLEQSGACLRAAELAGISEKEIPAGLETLFASMKFPD